ncbi:hypothetical protein AOQ84DRAFT_383560 [Glonium stellatum]|uniref:Uncharacterized protein n=1 Tax=Glonium stellatum TaxID=574774 RepID=A0A8E2ENR0_9PEZI|nr:hypothetical protein AOQ84DRAFT_383560 [Glonium stellatum]
MGYIISGYGAPSDAPPSVLDTNSTTLHGYFNSSHLSGLNLYYPPGRLPTPWPWLLLSMLLSLALGVIGVRSAFASWKDVEPTRFAIIRTTACFAWNCIRAVVAFIIALKASLDTGRNHPPPSSLLLLLGSIQTYIGSRSIPLICNFILVLCQILVYAALILAMDGSYGQFAIEGGNCPPDDGYNYAQPVFVESCLNASREWATVGCAVVPGTDGNDSANKIVKVEQTAALIGGVYVLTIILALFDTVSVHRSALFHPVKRESNKRLKFAVWMAVFSLIFGAIFTPIVVATHYNQLKRPEILTYVDSWGTFEPINRTASSARASMTFDYGDAEHWTDCFGVPTPANRDGFWSEWWHEINPVARILAFV